MERLIRINEVINITGKSRSSIYADIADGSFPDSIKIGTRSVAWTESAISGWIRTKMDALKQPSTVINVPKIESQTPTKIILRNPNFIPKPIK